MTDLISCSFGQQLRTSLIKDYYYYYIAYDDLKDRLKTPYETDPTADHPNPKRRPWDENDEKAFVGELEGELDKVFTFQRVKTEEVIRRLRATEREVAEVIDRVEKTGQLRPSANGNFPDQDLDEESEEDFLLLEYDINDIIADVHDLAQFTRLNYTGFQKIIKKHDVSFQPPNQSSQSLRGLTNVETNSMASQTYFCHPIESKAIFQGQLRCYDCQVIKALRRRTDKRQPDQG